MVKLYFYHLLKNVKYTKMAKWQTRRAQTSVPNGWDTVSFAVPYEYKEKRYREAKLEDIRDMKIDKIIGNK